MRHPYFFDMNKDDAAFFRQIGERIAHFRKEQNLTQVQLAQMLNLKQAVIASYEIGRRRVPVSLLPPLAKCLGISLDELMGNPADIAKRGPTPKLQQQVEQISRLPKAKQRFVSELLETVLQKA
jgi:transcriptional regulator with XRE-family HTH domain